MIFRKFFLFLALRFQTYMKGQNSCLYIWHTSKGQNKSERLVSRCFVSDRWKLQNVNLKTLKLFEINYKDKNPLQLNRVAKLSDDMKKHNGGDPVIMTALLIIDPVVSTMEILRKKKEERRGR